MAAWPLIIESVEGGCPCDYILFNNAQQLSESPPHVIDGYDFQLVQIPLRSLVPEAAYFRIAAGDTEAYQALFDGSCTRLAQFLRSAMRWNIEHGIPTFVFNYLVPQQNPMGRLLPRYHLSNFAYFVERLNEALARELESYRNAYFFDFDQVVSTYGRRYFQDDNLWQMNHNAALTDADSEFDQNRIEDARRARDFYPARTQEYLEFAWRELVAMHRTLSRTDEVKLVVVDLDDTLWRGVAAEGSQDGVGVREGWPLGFVEALGYLRRRGILLAVASKNEENVISSLWPSIMGDHVLSMSDFAIRRINWRTKAENLAEIFQVTNILPRNALLIDDNPVERAAVKQAYPDIRVIGPTPLLWRRILLWSPETQVASITRESARRTEMVQAQAERERQRESSREEFLGTLELRVEVMRLESARNRHFDRALELLNKTNQFNTTGKRWSGAELAAAVAGTTSVFTFSASDRFTDYESLALLSWTRPALPSLS